MSRVKLISPVSKQQVKKIRAAAYCRVSSSSADQLNSYKNQIDYYEKMFNKNADWEPAGIFADEGISGMKAENRPEFQRMIKMCENGKIDLIITKSVSRFARNVKDALSYVRKLKLLNVGVRFEKEGISTMSMGDEMLLNVFTAIAQEESKSISQHQRASITGRMERGEYVDSNAPYGFRLVNKELQIYDPEAEIVRWIFKAYLDGMSTTEIAEDLTAKKIPAKSGKEKWRPAKISYMLTNERYIGDCFYQKTYRDTTVPFKQSLNRGEEDRYYACGTHEGIIEKETFEKAGELIDERRRIYKKEEEFKRYPLTGRIRCKECGSFYRRKVRSGGIRWVCASHEKDAQLCASKYYSEERIYSGFISMVNKLRFCRENVIGRAINGLENAERQYEINSEAAAGISGSMDDINAKILMLSKLKSKGYIAPDIYYSQVNELKKKLDILKKDRKEELQNDMMLILKDLHGLKNLLDRIKTPLEKFDEILFSEIVTDMEISKNDELTMTVPGGFQFTEII